MFNNILTYLSDFIKILIESAIISAIVSSFTTYKFSRKLEKIKKIFEYQFNIFNNSYNFKLKSLEELLGPININIIMSRHAKDNYDSETLKSCIEIIFKLLMEKSYLIPSSLNNETKTLIEYYDEWLKGYYKWKKDLKQEKTDDHDYYYISLHNFPNYPIKAENSFVKKYEKFRKELGLDETPKFKNDFVKEIEAEETDDE